MDLVGCPTISFLSLRDHSLPQRRMHCSQRPSGTSAVLASERLPFRRLSADVEHSLDAPSG
jgi:hypothetical protein